MRPVVTLSLRCVSCLLAISLAGAVELGAQNPRDSLIAKAKEEFDAAQRIRLLVSALDPAYGPPQGPWGDGVQLLAQTMIDDGRDSVATLWLRWAVRLSPGMQPDTVQFPPQVTAAFLAARRFVNQTSTAGDIVTRTTWLWPSQGMSEAIGRIQVAPTGLTLPVQVSVEGTGLLRPGSSALVVPASYVIGAAATGYDSVHVTREVLPGATTVLEFHLRQTPLPVATHTPLASPQKHRRGIPALVWVAAGAGGLFAILWNVWIKHS